MAGLEDHKKSANDNAYFIIMLITYFSVLASPVLFGLYGWLIYKRRGNAIQQIHENRFFW